MLIPAGAATLEVPFVTTSCNWDIRASLLTIPLFWAVGLDQFIWPVLACWIFLKWLLLRKKPLVPGVFVLLLLALLGTAVSCLAIEEGRRFFTFLRNVGVFTGGVLVAFTVVQTHRSVQSILRTVGALILFSAIMSLSGLLSVMGLEFSFQSPLGGLVPQGLAQGYLQDIFTKSFTTSEASWFESGFIRPKGMMMYPNLLAGVLLMSWPMKLFYWFYEKSSWRWGCAALFIVDSVVVLHTLSRSAWLGFFVAFFLLFVLGRIPARIKFAAVMASCMLLLLMLGAGGGDIVTKRFEKGHSNEGRALNYLMTIDYSTRDARHFLFGYGTQRDVPELGPPIGSHSTFFGILFKYGLFGLSLAVMTAYLILARLLRLIRKSKLLLWRHLGRMMLCSILVLMVQSAFIEIDVDATYSHVWWILVGLGLALCEIGPPAMNPDGDSDVTAECPNVAS